MAPCYFRNKRRKLELKEVICKYCFCSVDHITIPSSTGRGKLHRVSEVFDCWFESGSMPYAQNHYPFERKSDFENNFPADFIAEGLCLWKRFCCEESQEALYFSLEDKKF